VVEAAQQCNGDQAPGRSPHAYGIIRASYRGRRYRAAHLWYKIAMTLFDLAGKVALVTGSTKGIGKAIAERLAEHGAKVVVSSRKAEACNEVAAGINQARGAKVALPIACNINYKDQLQALVEETRAKLGPIDVLVCNAAVNPAYGSMSEIKDEAFDKILGANIRSNHWLAQLVLPDMIAKRDGAIIIVSSIGGYRGSTSIGTYCISKAADLQLARNLAVENGPHNVRVNCIAPGLVKTDFARALWDTPDGERRASSGTPLRRLGEPDDIAGAAVFLASRAGAWMTGQSIIIDGGTLA
jgi:NAD(P)-dependent dehydrogenase (short-subunit alcohol dehydrogenase family)